MTKLEMITVWANFTVKHRAGMFYEYAQTKTEEERQEMIKKQIKGQLHGCGVVKALNKQECEKYYNRAMTYKRIESLDPNKLSETQLVAFAKIYGKTEMQLTQHDIDAVKYFYEEINKNGEYTYKD